MRFSVPLLMAMLFANSLFAQNFAGYNTSNYIGVNGVFFNPANIADSRFRWDFNLLTVNGTLANDYATFKFGDIKNIANSDKPISDYLVYKTDGDGSLLGDIDILGPSIMFNATPKNTFAITTRVRSMVNFDAIPASVLKGIKDNGTESEITYPATISNNSFLISNNNWLEGGISFARILKNDNEHFFKAGISAKYLMGAASAYVSMKNFSAVVDSVPNGNDEYFIKNGTGNISVGTAGTNFNDNVVLQMNGMGIGADLGFVYEYRPNYAIYKKSDLEDRRDQNKYKFRVALSVLDIGKISYNKNTEYYSYLLNTNLNPNGSDTLSLTRFDNIDNTSNIRTVLDNSGPMVTNNSGNHDKMMMSLPTSVNLLLDYNVAKNFYVGAEGLMGLNKSISEKGRTHRVNYLTITPRYDSKIFSLFLPVGSNELSGLNAGIGLRVGFFTIGSGMIISSLLKGETKHANVYAGIRFGIKQKNKNKAETINEIAPEIVRVDTDGDGVVDDLDKCPTEKGLASLQGCPDSDNDGIADADDKCPNEPGLAKYAGCQIPDTDGDGINDEMDKCVDVPGVEKYQGCPIPDSDGDGVNDEQDKCPTIAGTVANSGCPEVSKTVIDKITFAAKNIFFATGSAKLLPKSFKALDEVANLLLQDTTLNLQIDGHTDSQGNAEKNQLLSESRANAVADYLTKKDVAISRLHTTGFGATKPIADNTSAAGRAQNRRTEMTVRNF